MNNRGVRGNTIHERAGLVVEAVRLFQKIREYDALGVILSLNKRREGKPVLPSFLPFTVVCVCSA